MAEETKNFHKSIRAVIRIANILGLLPVNGIISDSVDGLNFRWLCTKTVYTFSLILLASFETLCTAIVLLQRGISTAQLCKLMVLVAPLSWLLILIAYLHLARKWPKLIKKWIELEMEMQETYKYPSSLDATFKRIIALFLVASTVVYTTIAIKRCQQYTSLTVGFELYSLKSFVILNFTDPKGVSKLIFIISGVLLIVFGYFAWVANTLLIITVSTAVALRFRQITARLRKYGMRTHSFVFWFGIRTDYIRLCRLCRLINEHISIQITIAIVCNFSFIVLNVFGTVSYNERMKENRPSYIHLAFQVLQLLYVGLYTAWVNEESKKPLEILNSVPSANYNNAIKMFVDHISFDTVALCGYKFFRCTKGLLLTIAGAVVTYELLLVQFTAYISR